MKVGQTYKIKVEQHNDDTAKLSKVIKKARLIFEGKYFYTFEYKSKSGGPLRATLYKRDNNFIEEVI